MTGIDIGILAIIAVSTLVSFIRGFYTEAISLATWIAALVISTVYAHQFGSLFRNQLPDDVARGVLSFIILFIGTLLIGSLINYLFSRLRTATRLSPMDRTFGVLFGGARGILLICLIVLAAHLDFFTSLRDGELWNTSNILPYFVRLAKVIHGVLPNEWGSYFDFNVD